MSEPMGRWSAVETIGRGVQEAPALKTGIWFTLALMAVVAGVLIYVFRSKRYLGRNRP